jgi:hypothetical protein
MAVEARADAVYLRIWGTAEQKEAAEYLVFEKLNQPTVDCMDDAGFTFEARFRPLWTGWEPDSTESGGWMGALDRAQSDTAIPTDEPATPAEHTADYESTLNRCVNSQDTPSVDSDPPAGVNELSAEFHTLLDQVNEELGPIAPYQKCMTERGVDLQATGETGPTALSMYLQGVMPSSALDRAEPSTEWRTYLDLEGSALEADRACREANYLRGLQLLDQPLADFEAAHAADLRRTATAWQDRYTQATATGYTS